MRWFLCLCLAATSAQAAPESPPKTAEAPRTFVGQEGWLVLGASTKSSRTASTLAHKARAKKIEATAIASDLFTNLKPGNFTIVHGCFATRAAAKLRVLQLKRKGIKAYAKKSGAPRGRLVRLHGFAEHLSEGEHAGMGFHLGVVVELADADKKVVLSVEADAEGEYELWTNLVGKVTVQLGPYMTKEANAVEWEAYCGIDAIGPEGIADLDLPAAPASPDIAVKDLAIVLESCDH